MTLEAYCKYCKHDVQRIKKEFSWSIFWAWTLFSFFTLWWVYPLYRVFVQHTRCHKCNAIIIGWDLKPLYRELENG